MIRALDELAEALHLTNGAPRPRRVAASVTLWDQFGQPITPKRWAALEGKLACPLPALESRGDGLWSFPSGWRTVWDLAAHLLEQRPSWHLPSQLTLADWQNAQVFAGVRSTLVEALNVDAEDIHRPSRLQADLGA
jgi:hypothetical protein